MTMRRFGAIAAALVAALVFAVPQASALEIRPFDQAEFDAAQADGTPIIVDVHAEWCSTCRAMREAVTNLSSDPRFADLVVFNVDYDREKHIMRMFHVASRSTFIAFQGETEIDRLYAVTDPAAIEAFLLTVVE